jgi:hypothetical protein
VVAQVQKIAVKEGFDPKSVTVQNTSPDAKEVTVPIAVVHNTPADVKKSDVPPGPLAVVGSQDPPSRAEARAELQAVGVEVQAAQEAADNINPLGGRVENVMLTAKDGPANLDTADNFSDTYLKPLKIFNSMIDTIANVWVLLLHQDGLIHSIGTSVCKNSIGRIVLCIKSTFCFVFIPISCSDVIGADCSRSSGSR